MYLQLKDQHSVAVEEQDDELEDKWELEWKRKAPAHHCQLEVYHEDTEVDCENGNVCDKTELTCV